MRITVKIDKAAAEERLARLKGDLADRAALHKELGRAVEMKVIGHLRGLPGRSFYKEAAEATRMESSESGATVIIEKRGMALRYYGGVVRPTGRISSVTGKPI